MTRLGTLRCSAALLSLALIAAPAAFAPALFGSAPVLAQTTTNKQGNAETTVPDRTYGAGGKKVLESDPRTYELIYEDLFDSKGVRRQRHSPNYDPTTQTQKWLFYDTNGEFSGFITLGKDTKLGGYDLIVWSQKAPQYYKYYVSLEEAEKELIFQQDQLRFWSSGAAGPLPPPGTPGYGYANPNQLPPGAEFAINPRTQSRGLAIQCFGDLACERAQAANRGEPYDFGGRGDDKGRERDDRKDRPLYERPDLPSSKLPYEPGLPYRR